MTVFICVLNLNTHLKSTKYTKLFLNILQLLRLPIMYCQLLQLFIYHTFIKIKLIIMIINYINNYDEKMYNLNVIEKTINNDNDKL